jgi:uncharacterized protein (DUF169 family)
VIKVIIDKIKQKAVLLKEILNLSFSPVGVKFNFQELENIDKFEILSGYRYCQALMKARSGASVYIDADGIACPAAAAAFGFRSLPEGLKNGKGLQGFGIVREAETGENMFKAMTVLEQGKLKSLQLFPLEDLPVIPDIVIIEDEVEKLMWIALAKLNSQKGERIISSTAVLQATCVDATLIPFKEQKFNMSFGCYGCRDATNINNGEAVLGFPIKDFDKIVEYVMFLSEKALSSSRSKNAFRLLSNRNR